MKFFIATIVAMNVGAQELSSTPIYTPDYSGIDNSSVGELIRKIAGSDNKKIIKDNLIVLFDSEKLELNKNNYANLKKLGFDCDQERCKYIANFYSGRNQQERHMLSVFQILIILIKLKLKSHNLP